MWFAIAQIVAQGFGMERQQEAERAGWEAEKQLREIAAQQERSNAEAAVAARTAEYTKVMEAQDLIFGTQGRKMEGSVSAIEQASEQQFQRDVSLIRAAGASRAQMQRAGIAGSEYGLTAKQAAERRNFATKAASSIATYGTESTKQVK